jgi:hypothetical protein
LSPFANWSSTLPSPRACISIARSRAYSMPPFDAGVRISSAPYAVMLARRSADRLSGMISVIR